MERKQMKRRIFAGQVCEQIVYTVTSGVKNPAFYDPERKKRQRFKSEEEYARFRLGVSRRSHARSFNANFVPGDLYVTLTFSDEWEVHTFAEAKAIRKSYVRSLRWKYPDAVIRLYMGRGKATSRIHFHMVVHGVPQSFLEAKWKYGTVKHCRELRRHNFYNGIDYGADFTGLANYLFDHWTPEQGGHHWHQTKNNKQPDREDATEVKVQKGYSPERPPIAPKGYKLVETITSQYGYVCFKYIVIPEPIESCQKTRKRRPQRREKAL